MSQIHENDPYLRPESDSHQPARLTRNGRPQPRPIRAIPDVPGFPTRYAPVPAHASCKEICERFPNSIRDSILDDFLYHNWSAQQIFAALAPKAKDWMTGTQMAGLNSKNPANAIAKRLGKRRDKHIKAGTLNKLKSSQNVRPSGASFQGIARPKYARRSTVAAADETAPTVYTPPKTPNASIAPMQQRAPAKFDIPQLDRTPSTTSTIRSNLLDEPYEDAWIFEQPLPLLEVDSGLQYQTYEPVQPVNDGQYSYPSPYMGPASLNEDTIGDVIDQYDLAPVSAAVNLFMQDHAYGINNYYAADQRYPANDAHGQQIDYKFARPIDEQYLPRDHYFATIDGNTRNEITVDDIKKYPDVLYDTDDEDNDAKLGY